MLEGKYRLLDEVGRGGMGTVFRAVDQSLDRIVAVKFLLPELQSDQTLVDSFRREARAVASIRHENVLQIYAFGEYGGTPFFVSEYVDGQTADDLIVAGLRRNEFVALGEVLRIFDATCAGLGAVHRNKVVHRDIKPGNLMIHDDTQRVVIMDFGLGHRYKPGDPRLSAESLEPGGTPAYMAPELIQGKKMKPLEERACDIYALGVTAFELITSDLPFNADNWVDIFQMHLAEPPPLPSTMRADVPQGLDEVVIRCLAKDPSDRFQTAEEIREALQPIIRAAPTPRPLPTARERDTAAPAPASVPPVEEPRVKAASSHAVVERRRARSSRAGGRRVIVADPDPAFRSLVLEAVEAVIPGSVFRAARTVTSALELARAAPPLVMVVPAHDEMMNGLELAASVMAEEGLEKVRIILTAERVTAQERKLLEQLGIWKVMLKPVTFGEMEQAIALAARDVLGSVSGDETR